MNRATRALLVAAAAALTIGQAGLAEAAKPGTGTPTTYSGSAYALEAKASVLGHGLLHVGPISPVVLPSAGGMFDNSLVQLSTPAPLAIQAGVLNAAVVGSGSETHAWASTVALGANVADVVKIQAGVLQADARATCTGSSGTATILDLAVNIGGEQLDIPAQAAPNTVISVPGIAKVTLNEQGFSNGRFFVNALHVQVGEDIEDLISADIVVSHAEAGINCGTAPPTCTVKDFVTGGGWIAGPNGTKRTFGLVGGVKQQGFQGHVTYTDHGTGQQIKSGTVSNYSGSGTTRTIYYDNATVTVRDSGEPGTSDAFAITSGGYSAAGDPIARGNIQLHQPAGCAGKKGGRH